MKKSFLKKLAFAMAFATTVTTLAPAAGVLAAKTPSLSAKSKTLLLGNEERDSYNFDIKNKEKGSTYKWTSDDKKVATVKSNGVVTAKGIGKTEITCTITRPNGKKLVLEAPVTVKENMETITINNAPTEAIATGKSYNFNRDYTTVSGGKTTDITRWEVINADGKATIKDNGVFKATEPGEYKVVALGFQSKAKYDLYLAGDDSVVTARSEEVTIKVAPSIVSVTQKTSKKFEVAFDAVMKDEVNKDNLIIKNAAGVIQTFVKSVSFDSTGKVATVESYINLTDKEVYTVTYKEMSKDFTASVGAAAKIVITEPAKIEDNVATEIKYELFDANNIKLEDLPANAYVTFARVNDKGWVDGNMVQAFNVGDVVTVKATYHSNTYDANGNEIKFDSAEFAIVCVDDLTPSTSNLVAWTITDKDQDHFNDADWGNLKHQIPVNATGKYLAVKAVDTAGKDVFKGFKYESTNYSKLNVDPNTGALVPLATGEVGVIITSGTYKTVVTVTILTEAKEATVEANKTSTVLSNAKEVDAKDTFKLTVKDQYNNKVNVSVSDLSVVAFGAPNGVALTDAEALITKSVNDGVGEFTFHASKDGNEAVAGTYNYKLTAKGKVVVVTVSVRQPDKDNVGSYRISATTSVDLKVNNDTKADLSNYFITVNAYAYDKNGIAIKPVPMKDVVLNHSDGTKYSPVASGDAFTFVFTEAVTVSGTAIKGKMKTGDYTITGTLFDGDSDNTNDKKLVSSYLVVKDSTPSIKVEQKNIRIETFAGANFTDYVTALEGCFGVSSNNGANSISFNIEKANVKATRFDDLVAGTYNVFVQKLTVTENYNNVTQTRTVDVNTNITIVVK